ncbi:MAG: DNA-directed RNA polymerase subunit omega, partial [Candidatus Aureabacteria bacterium]|nr:DNA-directed RNA polymerase subunit omega [Candidatus Auribacterota bacterium]
MVVKRFSIEELSKKCDNIYSLVRTLAYRAMEINRGAQPLLLKPKSKNSVTIALEEILADKIKVLTKTERDNRKRS